MKTYICMPARLYDQMSGSRLNNFTVQFDTQLRKYYGKLDLEVIRKNHLQAVEIYIMGKPKYSGFESDIREDILKLLQGENLSSGRDDVHIKMNYEAFNPKFRPVSDEKAPAKPAERQRYAGQQHDTAEQQRNGNGQQSGNGQQRYTSEQQRGGSEQQGEVSSEFDYEKLSYNYQATEPRFSFEQVILPKGTRDQIERAIGILEVEHKVFDEWGLRSIIPEATSALSFYGPPGTGKSMTAEAVAHRLGKKILKATYADIESKYHGEGPKMVKAIFKAAERENAVLFLDESDSLLSKRLTNVSDGSAQAINSMRSQLLISLEDFSGIVIFATNLVVNYDKAFLSRLINIEFTFPTKEERVQIWWNHLKTDHIRIPLAPDIDIPSIAEEFELCGREIKNSVKNACIAVALAGRDVVGQNDLVSAAKQTLSERERVYAAKDQTGISPGKLDDTTQKNLRQILQKKLDENPPATDSTL